MRVLVTGYKGFIGQNLVQYIYDNTDWSVDLYEWGDSNMPSIMEQDWVIHLGAISSTTERDLDKVMRQNVDFTRQIFDACKTYGVNLQYSSSASLYGMGRDFKETAMPDPRTPYAWSKYLCEYYHRQHQGGNVVQGFRYFNVYGDYEEHKGNQGSPVSQFSRQAEVGKIKLFHNSDNYLRDFVAVRDVCRVHVEYIKRVKTSGIWNVGTGKATSFQNVADLVSRKYDAPIEYIDMPEILKSSYQTYTCADTSKLEDSIGTQRWITLEEWLDKYKL
jgi:ADP-L-glycero-D-manno-heptose 6-epimerase